MISTLIVEDQTLVRTGLKRLMANMPDLDIVGEAETGEEAIALVHQLNPDVILMDVEMPGIGGIEAARRILHARPSAQIVMMSNFADDPNPKRLLEAGAAGYLSKYDTAEVLLRALRSVAEGQRYVCSRLAQKLALSVLPGGDDSPFANLSQRETEVLMMVARGDNIQTIADTLSLSPKTVSTYRYRLFDKLGVNNDVGLSHVAIRHGLVVP